MTSEAQELLKLIDDSIKRAKVLGSSYVMGMEDVRWLVYNFFNAPRNDDIEDAGTKDFGL